MKGYEKENTIYFNGEYYDVCNVYTYHQIPSEVIRAFAFTPREAYVAFTTKNIARQIADKLLSDGLIKVEQGEDFIRVSLDKILIPKKISGSYMNERIQLWHGDCLELMNNIPDKSVDAIICDLPYGVLNKGNKNAEWDEMLPLDRLWEQYCRIIKDDGAIVLFGQGLFTAQLMMSNTKMWRYNLVWDKVLKSGFLNANRMPLRQHEDILVFYKKMPVYNPQFTQGLPLHGKGTSYKNNTNRNYGAIKTTDDHRKGSTEKYPSSILRFDKPHPSKALHQTEKPVALIECLIKTFSNEKDLILDNTAGSMTTAIAAINTNRRCICIEKDEHYFEVGKKRVEDRLRDLELW